MKEVRIFFTAIMFYTRIPCPKWVDHDPEYIDQSIRYFPIIGWIAGMVATAFYLLGAELAGSIFGIVLSLIGTILLTGAFHEDGFADFCDGFGGGWRKDQILAIMKDSRVGAYGVIGLVFLFFIKAILMHEVLLTSADSWLMAMLILINGHTLSRFMASTFVYTHKYVRDDHEGLSKPAVKKSSGRNMVVTMVFAFIPFIALLIYANGPLLLLILPALYLVKWRLGKYFIKWIGGYTGDCLGASQQILEVVFYLTYILQWKFIL